jgi:hypothetical protein
MGFLSLPLALLGLASLPVLGGIYWLRNRFRQQEVSSLVLWAQYSRPKEGGRKLQHIQTPLLFFLELLVLLLLILAATRPMLAGRDQLRHLLVVLDNSYSMGAETQGDSARDRALKVIGEQMDLFGHTRIRFILAGDSARILGPAHTDFAAARLQLEQWTCQAPQCDLTAALVLAGQLSRQWTEILVVTDHAPEQPLTEQSTVLWYAVGRASANPAILNAVRSHMGGKERVLIEIADPGGRPGACELRVEADLPGRESRIVARKSLALAGAKGQRVILDLKPDTPAIRATLHSQGPDCLALDNQVLLLPQAQSPVQVQMHIKDTELRGLLEKAIDATAAAQYVTNQPELFISDSPGRPAGLAEGSWWVQFVKEEEALCYTGPYTVDRSEPLVEGLSLQGVLWGAGRAHDPNDPNAMTVTLGKPVVLAGNVPLMTILRRPGRGAKLTLRLVPELSSLPQSPNWPIFLHNLLLTVAGQRPGPTENNLRLGALVSVNVPTTTERLLLQRPDTSQQTMELLGGTRYTTQVVAETCGHYGVKAIGPQDLEMHNWSFSVNALNAQESDLSGAVTDQWGNRYQSDNTLQAYTCLSAPLLLGALAVLAMHLILLNRQTRGAL